MAEVPSVVVTGTSRGIGRATALLFAERAYRCFLLGRASPAQEETLRACRHASNLDHQAIECDLADTEAIDRAAAQVLSRETPRAVINNAAIVERAPLEVLSLESWRRQLDVNLLGPVWLTRALLPAMRAAGEGSIVNVASISAQLGTARQIAYNASKWALLGFTKSLAEELSDSGLMTVAVLPGAVDTDMLSGSSFDARMTARDVAQTLVHYALDAPLAHNGGVIEMLGV